ncbi:hypothetical protein AC1031_006376 [Aphanomyces cochlioides]|nr:hypothetical protein AC1031_006376 [Aphanomyces cochlioides]
MFVDVILCYGHPQLDLFNDSWKASNQWRKNGVIPVTIDPNGDIASLSEEPISFNECSSRDWSNVPIVLSCGCDFRRKTNGTSNGYDQGAYFWCNAGAGYFHINILHPDCTDVPTLAPTPEPTPSVTPQQTPVLTPTTTTRAPSTAAPKPTTTCTPTPTTKPTPTAQTSLCGKSHTMSTTLAMISLKPTVPTTKTVATTAPIHLDSKVGEPASYDGARSAQVTVPTTTRKPTTTPAPIQPSQCAAVVDNVDYPGNDIAQTNRVNHNDCCADCAKTPGCVVYVWTSWNDGTCFLKSKVGQPAAYEGAKAAVQNRCNAPQANTDYYGNDMDNIAGSKESC